MIAVEHLTKKYGDLTAVRDLSFKVDKGKIWGLLGPNAAGKTTTMRILTGFLPATDGQGVRRGLRRLRAAERGQEDPRLSARGPAPLSRT